MTGRAVASPRRGAALLAACAVLAGTACDPQLHSKKALPPEPGAAVATGAYAPPAPAPTEALAGAALLGGMLQRASEPGPYDDPRSSPGASADEPHHVLLELGGPVVELEDPFAFFAVESGVPLRKLVERLHGLADEENTRSILLRLSELGLSMPAAEELRAAIAVLPGDKPVHCYLESASDLTYYVATACDSIALAPGGAVLVQGPAMAPIYFREALDKLGIQGDFIHIGAYKGAAEPLTQTEPSAQMRETLEAVVEGAYRRTVEALAEGRKVDAARARAWIDQALFVDDEARKAGLVDEIAFYPAWREARAVEGWRKVRIEEKKDDLGELMAMLGAAPRKRITEPHVVLVYAVGEVVDGKGEGPLGTRREIASAMLATALRRIAEDDAVKAVVLRVDSPGGSALASEIIADAVAYTNARKPVVVSMGQMAASGGYYISAPATEIFAQPDTLTGSIGVVGGKIVLGPALDSLGIRTHVFARGKRAAMFASVRPFAADERQAIEGMMRATYERFKRRVAEGRKLPLARVEEIAQGRLWTGADAMSRGLVDKLGGLDDAIAAARLRVGLGYESPLAIYPPDPTFADLLGSLGQVRAPWGAGTGLLGGVLGEARLLLGPQAAAQLEGALRLVLSFRHDPVRAVVILPIAYER